MAQRPEPDTPRRHALAEVRSTEPIASPSSIRHLGDDLPWWTPSWGDRARAVGWRWIFALPAVVVLGLMAASFWHGYLLTPLWVLGAKVIFICIAIPVGLLMEVVRGCMAGRKDPFCIHCGYGLTGLPDHH